MNAQVLAFYAQGNSVEDIRRLIRKIYSFTLSAGQISSITDQVLEELTYAI